MRSLIPTLLTLIAFSGPLLAAPNGADLFSRHCAACHGHTGEGGVGVPISLPDFLASVDDTYLARTIRLGRPGRIMPAFNSLSDAQVNAIVGHLRSWEPEGLKSSLSQRPIKGDAGRGKALYEKHCIVCHGERGEGGSGTGVTFSRPRDYPIIPPALNNPGFLASASDAVIRATLIRGRDGTPMSSFVKQGLSGQQIDDIVSYVRSFEEHPVDEVGHDDTETAIVMASSYGLSETVENLKRAAIGKNFRIIRVQHLESGFVEEGKEDRREVIVYFCNFNLIDSALKLDPRVGLFMPCRITVVERDRRVQLMAINPKYLAKLYNNHDMDESCQQMYDIYTEIMEEATL